ncbi:MAG TPA: hypothetical protein VGH67_18845 [Solirubrobacteraceae bacterium]|jgi:hypothetical protein
MRDRIVKGALGAIVGGAAVGGAQRLVSHQRRPRVLGIAIPTELKPHLDTKKLTHNLDAKKLTHNLDPKKLANTVDLKDLLRKIGDAAEQIEARSEDVRTLSGQAKRLTRKLS